MLDGQRREEAANLVVAELGCGPTADKGLKPFDPKAVSFKGPVGVVAEFNGPFQVTEFSLPGGSVRSGTPKRQWRGCRRGASL